MKDRDQSLEIRIPSRPELTRSREMHGAATPVVCLHRLARLVELGLYFVESILQIAALQILAAVANHAAARRQEPLLETLQRRLLFFQRFQPRQILRQCLRIDRAELRSDV